VTCGVIQLLFTEPVQLALERSLDALGARAHLIAHNIANLDTPNYKALRLNFEDVLEREFDRTSRQADFPLRRTHPLHLPGHTIHGLKGTITEYGVIYTDDKTTYRLDGNNVDIDHETAEQAKNAIMYSTVTELVSRRFTELRTAISEGRR